MTAYGRYSNQKEELKPKYNSAKEERKKLLAEVRKKRAKVIKNHERLQRNTTE